VINKEKTSFYILVLAFFFLLIKISYIPFLPIAPLNLIFVLSLVGLLFTVTIKKNITTKIAIIIFAYGFINFLTDYLKVSTLNFAEFSNYILVSSLILHTENIKSIKYKERIINWYFFVGFLSIFYGYLIYFFGSPFVELRIFLIEINTDLAKFNRLGIVGGKNLPIVGLSSTSALYGYFIGSYFIISLHKYLKNKNNIYLFLSVFSFISLMINGERSVLFFTLICALGLFGKKIFNLKTIAFIFVLITTILFFQIELVAFDRIAETSTNNSADDIIPRLKRQLAGLLTFLESPIFGSTINRYLEIKNDIFPEDYSSRVAPHNAYINSLINIGFLAIILTYKYVINILKLKRLHIYNKGLFFALLFSLLNGVFHNAGPLNSLEISSVTVLLLLLINTNSYNASDKHNYGRIQRR
jgi:hypothetical protein